MNKWVLLILGAMLLAAPMQSTANVLPLYDDVFVPSIEVTIDGEPVTKNHVLRIRRAYGTDGTVNYERRLHACVDGTCYIYMNSQDLEEDEVFIEELPETPVRDEVSPEYIKKGKYNKHKDNLQASYNVTSALQTADIKQLNSNDIGYTLAITSADESAELTESEPLRKDEYVQHSKDAWKHNFGVLGAPLIIYTGIPLILIVWGGSMYVRWKRKQNNKTN